MLCKSCNESVHVLDSAGYCMTEACSHASELADRITTLEAQLAEVNELSEKRQKNNEYAAFVVGKLEKEESSLRSQLATAKQQIREKDQRIVHLSGTRTQKTEALIAQDRAKDLELVQLRERVRELDKDAALVRFAIETPPMEGYSREFCIGWAAFARELEASLDAPSHQEPTDG